MTLKRRGISSSVLVSCHPLRFLASRDPPQQAQLVGASMTTRSCSMSFPARACVTSRLRVKERTFCGL